MSDVLRKVRKRVGLTIVLLLLISVVITFIRLEKLDYKLDFLIPVEVFEVELLQQVDGYGDNIVLKTFLPYTDERQQIFDERHQSADMEFETSFHGGNRRARFYGENIQGHRLVQNTFRVRNQALKYQISDKYLIDNLEINKSLEHVKKYLQATDTVQVNAPEIQALSEELMPENNRLRDYLEKVFDHIQRMEMRSFKGTTDALTALRLGEASCNGRARLFVALMRAAKIPARLIGGLIMTSGAKRTSHQWLEVLVGGHWVPMDPTNRHFAKIPHHYLKLYIGDHVLFTHTADVAFSYHFSIKRHLMPRQEVEQTSQVLSFWNVFNILGIPLELLKVLIMIPIGALVVLIFRNVVGLSTFGTFLPVLIAAAARNSGLGWGAIGFCFLILFVSGVRHLLAKLELLHSPQLTVLLTTVIGSMLLMAVVGVHAGVEGLSKVSLFPVAIIAITSERFAVMEIEDGRWVAYKTMLQTLLVVVFCYITMASLSLQLLMLGFPELLLVVASIAIWIGRWTGLRLSEWIRFSSLLHQKNIAGRL